MRIVVILLVVLIGVGVWFYYKDVSEDRKTQLREEISTLQVRMANP